MYIQCSRPPYLSLFAKYLEAISASIFVDVPYWPHYSTNKFISCVGPSPSQWFFHFGEEIVIAWTTTLGGTESHHSSWQCQESHCCCHGPLAPLAMGDSGTSTVLTRYDSMRLQSLSPSERTTARYPVQHKRWTYPCYRALNTEHQQIRKRWCCTTSSKNLAKGHK